MAIIRQKWQDVVWQGLVPGMFVTGFCALSVHTLMADFGVPYPHDRPKSGWTVFIAVAVFAWALMYLCRRTLDRLTLATTPRQIVLLFVLTAMLRESLIRVPVMDWISSTALIYSFVNDSRRLITPLFVCLLAVPLTPKLISWWQRALGAILVGGFVQLLCYPLLVNALAHLLVLIAPLNHPDIYFFPYDWHIEIPAYITYLEPVIASFVFVSPIWESLSTRTGIKMLQFTLLVVLLDGILIRWCLYPLVSKFTLRMSLLSEGQFLLEAITLGLGTAVTWYLFGGTSQSRSKDSHTVGNQLLRLDHLWTVRSNDWLPSPLCLRTI